MFIEFNVIYQLLNIVGLININQTKLGKVNMVIIVIIYQIIDFAIIFQRHSNPAKLKALHEFLKINFTIKINVKVPECFPVVFKFLLESEMYLSE